MSQYSVLRIAQQAAPHNASRGSLDELRVPSATLERAICQATFGSGKTYNKEAYIKAMIGDGVVDATGSQTLADETVFVDRDTAVVIGADTARGTDKGEAKSFGPGPPPQ